MQKKKYNISVEATLEVMGGKWKCVILCHLTHGKKRTSELKRLMPNITQKNVDPTIEGVGKGRSHQSHRLQPSPP